VDEIEEIVEMIYEIAGQANMLVLNASTEADRVGGSGEGFAVVASEIKGLAEEVTAATADIEQRITAIQSTTTETVEGIEVMSERVEGGSETIEHAIEIFDEVAIVVQETEPSIREISNGTDDQAASSEEVVSMVDEVSSVNQQAAAEASNVSAVTEEQIASLPELYKNVQGLSRLSETLHDQVSMFSIRSDRAVERGSAADTARRSAVLTDGGSSSTPEDGSDSSLGGI